MTTDLSNHLWHPLTQMKDHEVFQPLKVRSAQGSYIELTNGQKIIDAISSWWCKPLGHAHPKIREAIIGQLNLFEHVMLAQMTHEPIERLSAQLTELAPGLNKVLYASDGACAVEMAMKLSVHMRYLNGESNRHQFVALRNSYHGETTLALAVSDLGLYRKPYESIINKYYFIQDVPYVNSCRDLKWNRCETHWHLVEKQLETMKDSLTAVIVEPIVQAAAGMQIYSKNFLQHLSRWCKKHQIHLIADEIFTGLGRTGKMLACEHADITPEFLCLGKGLSAGFLPISAVLTKDAIYDACYDDYETGKGFMHSHTYCGNPLAAVAALTHLQLIQEEGIIQQVEQLEKLLQQCFINVVNETKILKNIRYIGAIVAADLNVNPDQRLGFKIYQKGVQLGALLRPIGNTIYWCPPLNIQPATLQQLADITIAAIKSSID